MVVRVFALLVAILAAATSPVAADVIPSLATSFSVQFFNRTGPNSGVISSRFFTSTNGPADGQRLFTGVRLVRTNPNGGDWIGIERPSTIIHVKADQSVTNETSTVVALEDWPMSIAFDSKRLRNVLVSLSGEGALYQRNAAGAWSFLSSMQNRDLESLVYRASDDTFWGFDVHAGNTNAPTLMHQYSPTGTEIREWIWPPLADSVQPGLYHSEMVVTDDDAIMLLLERPYSDALRPGDHSKMILIRPEAGWFTTTYDQTAQQRPQVSFTVPANGASLFVGAEIPITVHVTDHDGDLEYVQLFDGATGLRIWTTNLVNDVSLSHSWISYVVGTHALRARAVDAHGNVTETTILVNLKIPTDEKPEIVITSPREGESFALSGVIPIVALSTNVIGPTQVSFVVDGRVIATRTNFGNPTSRSVTTEFRWSNGPAGNHALSAYVANLGRGATSAPVDITIDAPKHSPEVSIFSPTNNSIVQIGATVPITVHASDVDHDLNREELYDGENLLVIWIMDKTSETLRTYSWSSTTPGPHVLRARAFDAAGGIAETSIIVTRSSSPELAPVVRINSPRDGQVIEPGLPVRISATASNIVGLTEFSYFADTNLIGRGSNTPQATLRVATADFVWTNPPGGTYSLTTVILNQGSEATSAPVLVTIKPAPKPPAIRFVAPMTNSTIYLGETLNVTLEYSDPNNDVSEVDLMDGNLLLKRWSFKPSPVGTNRLEFAWTSGAPGSHTLRAAVYDSRQANGSANTLVNVQIAPDLVVERSLPDTYTAGQAFKVTLLAKPTATVHAWALEEMPPAGWTVRDFNGSYDQATRKLKWGPYTQPAQGTFFYTAVPGPNSDSTAVFSGVASFDGASKPIVGDTAVAFLSPFHPADLSKNSKISVDELTAYAAAWKTGAAWPVAPTNIPVAYVTRAGYIWLNGEAYRLNPSEAAPGCWAPSSSIAHAAAPGESAATRSLPPAFTPGRPVTVTLYALPGVGIGAYALQEEPPAGWTITDAGEGSVVRGSLRFGPYYDDQERTLTYTVTPATNALRGEFRGLATFDGSREAIGGASLLRHSHPIAEAGGEHRVRLRFNATPGQRFAVEAAPSLDSEVWETIGSIEGADGAVDFETIEATAAEQFYRLRPLDD